MWHFLRGLGLVRVRAAIFMCGDLLAILFAIGCIIVPSETLSLGLAEIGLYLGSDNNAALGAAYRLKTGTTQQKLGTTIDTDNVPFELVD
jgi:hypothetical protein